MDRRLTESLWCTGKDSNLRTSLGGTDLQSVGFNHSPTCTKPPGDAAVISRQSADRRSTLPLRSTKLHFHKSDFRNPGKPRIALTAYRAKITAHRKRSE